MVEFNIHVTKWLKPFIRYFMWLPYRDWDPEHRGGLRRYNHLQRKLEGKPIVVDLSRPATDIK